MNEKIISKENLYHLYIELCLSREEIAKRLDTTLTYINWCCRKYNLKKTSKQRSKTYELKTGYKNPSQNPDIKKKKEITCFKHFGNKNPSQVFEIKEKKKVSCFKHIGYDHPLKNPETKQIVQKKMKSTLLKNTGYENSSQNPKTREKRYKTLKKNNTFVVSKSEDRIYDSLSQSFLNVKRQYKSEKYPFACDFYIPEKDLYIEYQGNWTHGEMPYNNQDLKCQNQLEQWKEKATNSKYYKIAIETWTVRDVKKRKIAQENSLNWMEFFNFKEFELWLQSYQQVRK